jgi:hypothetical protein
MQRPATRAGTRAEMLLVKAPFSMYEAALGRGDPCILSLSGRIGGGAAAGRRHAQVELGAREPALGEDK